LTHLASRGRNLSRRDDPGYLILPVVIDPVGENVVIDPVGENVVLVPVGENEVLVPERFLQVQ
jgi:hypothetical protein